MGFFDFVSREQKHEEKNLTGVKENKKARVKTIEELERAAFMNAKERNDEVADLLKKTKETDLEVDSERKAAKKAIDTKDYDGYRAHCAARVLAEETRIGYQLRLEAIQGAAVLPKEDIAALASSTEEIYRAEVSAAYKKDAKLIEGLENIEAELTQKLQRLNHAARVLNRDVLRGDDLFFEDSNGGIRYIDLMFSNYMEKGRALRTLVYSMKRNAEEYEAVTGKPMTDKSVYGRMY